MFFYEVFQFCNLSNKFDRLTQVESNNFFSIFFKVIFFYFIIQHWVDWKMFFIFYFNLLSMRLPQPHDSGCRFDKLTWVDLACFSSLLFMRLFQSHDSVYKFSMLTRVDSNYFLYFFNWFFKNFYHSILDCLIIEFHNLFQFTFYKVILIL